MTIFVDDMYKLEMGQLGRMRMSHMITDGEPYELHRFAAGLGLRREWYQVRKQGEGHYDVSKEKRAEAIAKGAVEISMKELALILLRKRVERKMIRSRKRVDK